MKFSITVPAYKAKFLQECIESILSQTYPNFELIIVNDASPEDLKSIVRQFDDPRIHYYVNDKNCGAINVVDNWNKCLGYATGDYVICMGDDDRLLPNCLEEYVKLIGKYPGLGVYHGMTEIIDENSVVFKMQESRPEYESVWAMIYRRWHGCHQYIGDFLFSVDTLRAVGGFYKLPLAWGSDDISVYRVALQGVANTQIPVFQYRVNRFNISSTNCGKKFYLARREGVLGQHKWYRDFLKIVPKEDSLDYKYWNLLNDLFPSHCQEGVEECVMIELRADLIKSLIYWIRHQKQYSLTMKRIMVCGIIALAKYLYRK